MRRVKDPSACSSMVIDKEVNAWTARELTRVDVVIDRRWNGQSAKESDGAEVCGHHRRNVIFVGRQFRLKDVVFLEDKL